ncbi:MAG: hypothetical protein ACTSWQ_07845 [Candidatus Thorarchaeota archaeon]
MRAKDVFKRLSNLTELPPVYSENIYDFISIMLRDRKKQTILDFAAIPQSPIFRIAQQEGVQTAIACPNRTHIQEFNVDVLEYAFDSPVISKMENHTLNSHVIWEDLDSLEKSQKFDVVLGLLIDPSELTNACSYLKKDGIGIFHVHTSFFGIWKTNDDFISLKRKPGPIGTSREFHIQGAISIRSGFIGTCLLEWWADEYLIILENRSLDDLFVASIGEREENEVILENLSSHRNGKTLRYGFLTNTDYPAFDEFPMAADAYQKDIPLKVSEKASEIIREITIKALEDVETGSDSIIMELPKSDTLGVGYVKISIDSSRISPGYLNLYLKERVKHMFRFPNIRTGSLERLDVDNLFYGCDTPLEVTHRILNTYIHVAEMKDQESVLRTASSLQDLSSHIEILWKNLWTEPDNHTAVISEMKEFGSVDTLEKWIGLLPAPLASILWKYHAHNKARMKQEHLFNFFEAFTQFNTSIMLSALSWNSEITKDWQEKKTQYKNAFREPGMGSWLILGSRLAKHIRRLLGEQDSAKLVQTLFGELPREIIGAITSRNLWGDSGILKEILGFRNEWKGHSGVAGETEIKRRLNELESRLSSIRSVISNSYESMRLVVRKEEFEYKDGIHHYRASRMQGSQMDPLPEITVMTNTHLESGEMYFMGNKEISSPIKLLPFVRWQEIGSTGKNAFYFYNRIKNDKCRFVSFHSEGTPEITLPVNLIAKGLYEISPDIRV